MKPSSLPPIPLKLATSDATSDATSATKSAGTTPPSAPSTTLLCCVQAKNQKEEIAAANVTAAQIAEENTELQAPRVD